MTFGNTFIEISIYPEDHGRRSGIFGRIQAVTENDR